MGSGQAVVVYCEICGSGINLVTGDPVFKCVKCKVSPICVKCYNNELKMCVSCAAPILNKRQQDIIDENTRRQVEAARLKTIKDEEIKKKSSYSKENKLCYECGNKGSILWSLYKCPSCKVYLCGACVKKNSRCPACNGSLK